MISEVGGNGLSAESMSDGPGFMGRGEPQHWIRHFTRGERCMHAMRCDRNPLRTFATYLHGTERITHWTECMHCSQTRKEYVHPTLYSSVCPGVWSSAPLTLQKLAVARRYFTLFCVEVFSGETAPGGPPPTGSNRPSALRTGRTTDRNQSSGGTCADVLPSRMMQTNFEKFRRS